MLKVGALLVVGGVAVITGYWIYYAFRHLFALACIPMAIKVAIPVVVAGIIVLLIAVIRDRYQAAKKESFKEIER